MFSRSLGIALLLWASCASAQNVQQSGTITPGHTAYWVTSGVIADAGTSDDSPITSLGAAGPICSNSARESSGAWNQLCIQANTSSPAIISLQNFGTAPAESIIFNINGSTQGFPTVTPLPVTVGNVVCFNTTGGGLTSCGFPPSTLPLVVGVTPITGGTTNGLLYDNNGVLGSIFALPFNITTDQVVYTAPFTSAVQQLQTNYDSKRIYLTDFGADPTGVADSAPAIRAAIESVPYGSTLVVPSGTYLVNSCRNGAVVDFVTNVPNKVVSIVGIGWQLKVGGVYTNPQGSIFKMGPAIPTTCDFIHLAGTDAMLGGPTFKDFAVVASTGVYGTPAGRHGIFIDGSASDNFYIENMIIDHVFIDNMATGYSVKVSGTGSNVAGTLAVSQIKNSFLMNIQLLNVGDSVTIGPTNTFGSNATVDTRNVGVYATMVPGATSLRIDKNDFVNTEACVIIDSGITPVITDNECENSAGVTSVSGSMMNLRGTTSSIQGLKYSGNVISQLSVAQAITPLSVGAVSNASIAHGNRFYTPSDYTQINITSNAASTIIDDNHYNIGGTISVPGHVTDAGTASKIGNVWNTQQAQTTAPATPATGKSLNWQDATDHRFHDINAAGTIGTTAVAKALVANQFFTAMGVDGTFTSAPVASVNGVAYPASFTSGGIPYASGIGTIASSALLAANQIVLGGGVGTSPATLGSLGTTTTLLHGNASGAPAFGAVVSGDLASSLSLVTPALGAATATTLAVGGCVLGTNTICSTGLSQFIGTLSVTDSGPTNIINIGFSGTPGGYIVNMFADATGFKIGTNSAVRDVEIQANSVSRLFVKTGLSTDSTDAPTALGLRVTGAGVQFTAIASDTATSDSTVCVKSSDGTILKGTGALGICLGTSGKQFKTAFAPMVGGIDDIVRLNFQNYRYREGFGDDGARMQYGLTAQDVELVLPDLVRHDAAGAAINFDSGALLFIGLRAIQQLNERVTNLQARIKELEREDKK